MIVALANLFSLIATAALSAVIMTLAWARFGRSRVALYWALSSAATALQWAVGLMGGMIRPAANGPVFASGILLVLAGGLLAAGAREAGEREPHTRATVAVCAAMILWQAIALFVLVDRALWALTANIFVATAMSVAAWSVLPRGRPARSPEIAVALVFAALALFTTLLAALSPGIGAGGTGDTAETYRFLVVIALPGLYGAMGSAGIFLIAAQLAARVEALATRDPLTGVLNRRGIEAAAEAAQRAGVSLTVIVADLDRLKSINDDHGHHAGDAALTALANAMLGRVGPAGHVGRLSGDEFCAIMPCDSSDAIAAIDQMRQALAATSLEGGVTIGASFGHATMLPSDASLADALRRADQRLYEDKRDASPPLPAEPAPALAA